MATVIDELECRVTCDTKPVEQFFDNTIVDRMVKEGLMDKLYKTKP